MQICRQSIFFIFRVVQQAGTCLRQKPRVFLPEVNNNNRNLLNFFQNSLLSFSIMGKTKGGFYAVARGRQPGIYLTWDECKAQVDRFVSARYKKFGTNGEAQKFIQEHSTLSPKKTSGTSSGMPTSSTRTEENHRYFQKKEKFHGQMSTSKKFAAKSVGLTRSVALTRHTVVRTGGSISTTLGQANRDFSTTLALDKRKKEKTDEEEPNKRLKSDPKSNGKVNLKNFTVDEDGYVIVYTDGACPHNGMCKAKAGVGIWFGDNHPLNVSKPVIGKQTNNTAEILAVEVAIIQAKQNGIIKLNVKTDSQYVINCMNMWMPTWKQKNWKASSGKPVVNRSELERLDAATVDMDIKWSYVAGHQGHYGNECADKLAVAGANMEK